jgi:phenylpropionate dioxygenase-like ring-hydroxylating dioxygenase large terminal subunit
VAQAKTKSVEAPGSEVQGRASGRYDELVQEGRVHRSVYTDPEIFREEMVKVFGHTWVYLAHESEIPNNGDYKTGYFGTRPIIITRDKTGQVHALFNRCSHRAATVCREPRGNAKNFTCPYHGWTYSNTGRLQGVPWPKAYGPDFDRTKLSLGQVPRIESYRGFIFGTSNLAMPGLPEHLGGAKRILDQWIDRSPEGELIVRSGTHRMVYRGNWKLTYDNAGDGYHPAFSHRSLLDMAQRYGEDKDMTYFGRSPDEGPMYLQDFGNGHTFTDQRPAMESLWDQVRPMPGMEAYEAMIRSRYGDEQARRILEKVPGAGMNLNIFPNLLIIGSQIQVIEPIAVDRTQLTWYSTQLKGVPEEINPLRVRAQEDFPAFGEPDDMENFEGCQRGMSIPEVEWIDMSRGLPENRYVDEQGAERGLVTDEMLLRAYFREWKRRMNANVETFTA